MSSSSKDYRKRYDEHMRRDPKPRPLIQRGVQGAMGGWPCRPDTCRPATEEDADRKAHGTSYTAVLAGGTSGAVLNFDHAMALCERASGDPDWWTSLPPAYRLFTRYREDGTPYTCTFRGLEVSD